METNFIEKYKKTTSDLLESMSDLIEKSKETAIQYIELKDNVLNGVVAYYFDNKITDEIIYTMRYKLNGKDYEIKGRQHSTYFQLKDLIRKMYEDVSEKIALDLISEYAVKTGFIL